MANSDVNVKITADAKQANKEFKKTTGALDDLGDAGKEAGNDIDIGKKAARSQNAIQKEIRETTAAYNKLKLSGKLSGNELKRSADAARVKVKKLKNELKEASFQADRLGNSSVGVAGNLKALGAAGAAAFSVGAIINYLAELGRIADQYKNIEGQLKLVTSGSEELIQVQDDLFKLSQETATSYDTTAKLFTEIARSSEQLGLSNKEQLDLVETINKASQASNVSAQASNAAITQLNQSLSSGVLRGDEFNSIMEQAPVLAQAMADGLGVARGELRAMAEAGELSAERVTRALLDQKDAIDKAYKELPNTISRSVTRINNEWLKHNGVLDKVTGASSGVAAAFSAVADIMAFQTKLIEENTELFSSLADTAGAALLSMIPGSNLLTAYNLVKDVTGETTEKTKELEAAAGSLKETTDELTKSEYALQLAREQENEAAEAKQLGVDELLESMAEESRLLKLSAKELYIYNQIKKAGTDLTIMQTEAIRESAAALFDEKNATESVTEKLEEERKQLNMSSKDRYIYNQVKKAGRDASAEDVAAIKESATALFDERKALKETTKERVKYNNQAKKGNKKGVDWDAFSKAFGRSGGAFDDNGNIDQAKFAKMFGRDPAASSEPSQSKKASKSVAITLNLGSKKVTGNFDDNTETMRVIDDLKRMGAVT